MAQTRTLLKYEISLQPQMSIPSAIVTCVVKAGLPANIMAMAKRAEKVSHLTVSCSQVMRATIAAAAEGVGLCCMIVGVWG